MDDWNRNRRMFDGKQCKLCKECVLIVQDEQMQVNDNQAST